MKNKTNFRARVMKYAWQIFKATKSAWRECMLRAWYLYKLSARMKKGVVEFCYLKADGTMRKAVGTLRNLAVKSEGKKFTKPSYKTFRYYDVERSGFRSFKVENLCIIPDIQFM